MRIAAAEVIARLDGVAAVDPQIEITWERDPAIGFSAPDLLRGLIPGADAGHETFELEIASGRRLSAEDNGNVVVLGATLARRHGVIAGDSVEIRGESFQVVGTLLPTLTTPDTRAFIPLATAQQIYLGDSHRW